jgi:uncharacterized membrane-anchored protein YitT (DUF2179 family)
MDMFLVPAQLVSGGVSGLAQVVNAYTHWPIGLMVFVGNAPLFVLGWRYLGGPQFAFRTAWAVITFSLLTDVLAPIFPVRGITGDFILNSLYGGILLGIGLGLVYRGRGTSGGSDIISRMLNVLFALPISQAYLVADGLVVVAGGLAFGWEKGLYGLLAIYVSGLAAEAISEGSQVLRTAIIVSDQSREIASKIMQELERGVTLLPAEGAYTGQRRLIVYCAVTRSEVNRLKELIQGVDPEAFVVISSAHEALGEGFKPFT